MKPHLLIISVMLLVGIISLGGCMLSSSREILPKSPAELVLVYLQAMEAGDKSKLLSIAAPNHEIQPVLNAKLYMYKGQTLQNLHVQYIPTESDYFVSAQISGYALTENDTVKPFNDTIELQRSEFGWMIILGNALDTLNKSTKERSAIN